MGVEAGGVRAGPLLRGGARGRDLASARGPDHQGGGEGRQDSREGGGEGRPGSGAGGGEGRQGNRAGGGEGRQGHLRDCVWQKVAAPPRPPRLAKVLTIYSTIVLCRVRGRATCNANLWPSHVSINHK